MIATFIAVRSHVGLIDRLGHVVSMDSLLYTYKPLAVWGSGSALASVNEVTQRQDPLVLGWVTGPGFNSRCRKPISVYNQPPNSTQAGRPSVGRRNEYQPSGSDALRLESEGRYDSCVGGR